MFEVQIHSINNFHKKKRTFDVVLKIKLKFVNKYNEMTTEKTNIN